jgi:hypothetical protein
VKENDFSSCIYTRQKFKIGAYIAKLGIKIGAGAYITKLGINVGVGAHFSQIRKKNHFGSRLRKIQNSDPN